MCDSDNSSDYDVEDWQDIIETLTEKECPGWVINPYGFDNVHHLLKYGQRGPHELEADHAKFEQIFASNEVVKLRLKYRQKYCVSYRRNVGRDLEEYIKQRFGRVAVYRRGCIYVLPKDIEP